MSSEFVVEAKDNMDGGCSAGGCKFVELDADKKLAPKPVLSSAQTADANVSPTVQRLREPGVVLVDIRSAQEIADAPYT
eukprot:CAMPEP_0172603354 /NCGR_PEP_ID=MMETSP1068-20121228/23587_1 /TAXON_ID=35684 /ORGANISM="Pseudopedinella elastica, Strain CCMP716" /LENGTH=78 /DNA_ID=CAMNT_0013405057 /DNA_START=37 /DNA_END=270 /DNA_ORIENTATION=+